MSDVDRLPVSRREFGAILPMMAIMVVVLLGAAEMAVYLGWLFWQGIETGALAARRGWVARRTRSTVPH